MGDIFGCVHPHRADAMNTKPCPKCGKIAVEVPNEMVFVTSPVRKQLQWRCACGYREESRTITETMRTWMDDWHYANGNSGLETVPGPDDFVHFGKPTP